MKKDFLIATASFCLFATAACSPASEEVEGGMATKGLQAEADTAASEAETFEVCDENGNRYPSEEDAEAAGLSRAEYGATFCGM